MSTAPTTVRIAGLAAAAALILGGSAPALASDSDVPPPQRPCATSPQDRLDPPLRHCAPEPAPWFCEFVPGEREPVCRHLIIRAAKDADLGEPGTTGPYDPIPGWLEELAA